MNLKHIKFVLPVVLFAFYQLGGSDEFSSQTKVTLLIVGLVLCFFGTWNLERIIYSKLRNLPADKN